MGIARSVPVLMAPTPCMCCHFRRTLPFLYHHRRALDARRLTADARRRRSVGTVHRTALGAALAHNASLEAMRQAAVAAVAQSKSAGAIEDPTLSVSVAPRTLRGAMGASGDV